MRLRTLGGMELEGSPFGRSKPLVLLAYLSLEGPRDRRHLADLFWPGAARPLTNLSVALSQLRKGAPGAVQTDEVRVWAAVGSDARTCLQALEQGALDAALESYRGPFLEGVQLRDWSAELEEWVYRTREFLADRVRDSLLQRAEAQAASRSFQQAAGLAQRAFLLPGATPPEPDDLARLYTLLAAADNPYAREVRREAEAFELTLPESTDAARKRLRRAESATRELPRPRTPLVGRDPERADIILALRRSDTRLLTLTGNGGIGKTRLALQVAHDLNDEAAFRDGVAFISLETVPGVDLLPSRLAAALGLEPSRDLTLAEALAHREQLLVLDNFEHLVDGSDLLADLLEGAAGLKLLVTSRERLNLADEWTMSLEGLSFPADDTLPLENARYHDAVQLFLQRARRARMTFELDEEALPHVLEICRQVAGSPLGLELAAAWVRTLTPRDIAEEIRRDLDFLTATDRDADPKHRSLRAVFEYSWSLLSGRDQEALRNLAVFVGGFRKEAATSVASLSLPDLARLVDTSLLKMLPDGRFEQHPLLRQYLQAKLQELPSVAEAMAEQHARYYLGLLEQHQAQLAGGDRGRTLRRLGDELENIREGWSWAVARRRIELLMTANRNLSSLFEILGRLEEGRNAFAEAVAALAGDTGPANALARMLSQQARFSMRLGRYQEAHDLATRALQLTDPTIRSPEVMPVLELLGTIAYQLGEHREAIRWTEPVIAFAREQGDQAKLAHALGNLAVMNQALGDYETAERRYREVVALYRELGNEIGLVHTLGNLGSLLLNTGHYQSARAMTAEALAHARELRYESRLPLLLHNLAAVELRLEDFGEADQLANEALELARLRRERPVEAGILATQGRIAAARGDVRRAFERLLRSLDLAWSMHDLSATLTALLWLGDLHARLGDASWSHRLLAMVIHHPATLHWTRNAARGLLAEHGLPPDAPQPTVPLSQVVEETRARPLATPGAEGGGPSR